MRPLWIEEAPTREVERFLDAHPRVYGETFCVDLRVLTSGATIRTMGMDSRRDRPAPYSR